MWIEYTGEYEKQFYNIKLKDGKIINNCWPNAGTFHTDGEVIDGHLVSSIEAVDETEPMS